MQEMFIHAEEVRELLGISRSKAYGIVRQLNDELKERGLIAEEFLGEQYEVVYSVHTDKEHKHGHIVWNSVDMQTGKKYEYKKGDWKYKIQPITNKLCKEYGLSIMPAEYSKHPQNLSREKWEKEQSFKEYIL